MNASSLLHGGPAAGFDQPFEMLHACHARVQRMLALLQRLPPHLQAHGADAMAREAARDVARYFDLAAPAHHEDEERHVLPRLRASGQAALAQRLADDHACMRQEWAALRPLLARVEAGDWDAADAAPLAAAADAFRTRHESHLQAEEAQAFPAALAATTASERLSMGLEMASRRGVDVLGR